MKAAIIEQFGPPEVLRIKEVPGPTPKDDEVLIKLYASTVNAADCNTRGMTFIPPGLGFMAKMMLGSGKPKKGHLGSVLAGEVEAVEGQFATGGNGSVTGYRNLQLLKLEQGMQTIG